MLAPRGDAALGLVPARLPAGVAGVSQPGSPSMSTPLRLSILLPLLVCTLTDVAHAQEPKPGREWYEDTVDLGFKFKSPDGWSFVPPQPGELNMIGEYASPSGQLMVDPKSGRAWSYSMWIVAFDRRPLPEGEEKRSRGAEGVPEWVDAVMSPFSMRLAETDESRHKKLDTIEYTFEGTLGEMEVGLFATLYHLQPDLDVALVFNGPGGRSWKKFERAFKKVCGTLLPVEVEAREVSSGPMSLRDRKREELAGIVASQPGWELYETDNYFVLSSNEDRQFLEELMDRLEAIREVYEETYPPSLAVELKRAAKEAEAAAGEGEEEAEGEPAGEADEPGRTVAERADPMELSRTSVVRVCKDRDEYMSYGGPGGSAGYWSPGQRELVIFDDKAVGGRGNTWATLNHEAFHQYIFYFFGSLTPHYWYNEGTGDFYSGYEYKNKRFTLKPFDWRERLIQDLIRQETYVPLKEFVRYDRSQYYGENVGENYAQGWGLMYFLRTGKKGARCWNDDWDTILDTYLRVLVETDDLDQAVDAAFEGVDWEELEDCWKSYIG
jgi:hypothetical protein